MLYFAKYRETNTEILIFRKREEREAWVNFEDDFSRDLGVTAENAFLSREPITQKKAVALAGDAFDEDKNYYFDEISGNLVLFCQPCICREVKDEMRFKRILDLFTIKLVPN